MEDGHAGSRTMVTEAAFSLRERNMLTAVLRILVPYLSGALSDSLRDRSRKHASDAGLCDKEMLSC